MVVRGIVSDYWQYLIERYVLIRISKQIHIQGITRFSGAMTTL